MEEASRDAPVLTVIGALGRLTPESVRSALALARDGRVFALAQLFANEMPQIGFHGPFVQTAHRTYAGTLKEFPAASNRLGSLVCRYELSDHSGTHVDALNHAAREYALYGGADGRDLLSDSGTDRLGIDSMPPVVVRGILLDLPRHLGREELPPAYEVTVSDVEGALRDASVDLRPGDGVFFFTGRGRHWIRDNAAYLRPGCGPGPEVAEWMVDRGVVITGADTASYEVEPPASAEMYPCHQILIQRHGVHLVENLRLHELAATRRAEFAFVCAALPLKGGAGSPVAPIGLT